MREFPAGACDTHVHVYDRRFPASPAAVLHPADVSVHDYRSFRSELGLERVVFVQPTTYGLDNELHLLATAEEGNRARAVVVVDDNTSANEIAELHTRGARGARFHMLVGGAVPWEAMRPVADRIEPFGWHVQLQLDGRELADRMAELRRLPTPLVIDHIGRFMPPVTPDHDAFVALRSLLDSGHCWVKLSAPYESSTDGAPDHPDVSLLARLLVREFPERMLWASNWPHPGQTSPPAAADLRRLADDWMPDANARRRILVDNPAEVYGFDPFPIADPEDSP